MLPITERSYLQELRDTAQGMSTGNLNPEWAKAYQDLTSAADRLDAMHARCEVQIRSWCAGDPPTRQGI